MTVRLRRVAIIAALFTAPAFAAEPGEGRRCGEFCLRVALPGLGFDDAATAAAVKRLGVAPAAGHSVADLEEAVAAAGGHALAVGTNAERLRARRAAGDRFACVVHLDGDHFALLTGFPATGTARVIDPPGAYDLPPETLAARWDGRALLLSRDPLTAEADLPGPFPWGAVGWAVAGTCGLLAAGGVWWARRRAVAAVAVIAAALVPAGCGRDAAADGTPAAPAGEPPRAVFETVRRDAGTFGVDGRPRTVAFPLTNRGGTPLRVLGLSASCGCTATAVTFDVLAPGETGEVRATVRPGSPENRGGTIVVRTNDPAAPETTLTLLWRAVAPLAPDPPEVDFGPLRPGETATRTVRLVRDATADAGAAAVVGVETAPPGAAAAELRGDLIDVTVTAPAAHGRHVGREFVGRLHGRIICPRAMGSPGRAGRGARTTLLGSGSGRDRRGRAGPPESERPARFTRATDNRSGGRHTLERRGRRRAACRGRPVPH